MSLETPRTRYAVVINHEEQFSFAPVDSDLPKGWKVVRPIGSVKEALAYIEEVWTDMRPLSLRWQLRDGGRESAGRG